MSNWRFIVILGTILAFLLTFITPCLAGEVILDETFIDDSTYEYHITKTEETLSADSGVFDRVRIYPVQNFKGNRVTAIETIINRQYADMSPSAGDYVDIYYIGTNPTGSLQVHCGDGYFGYFKYSAYGTTFTKLYLHSDNFVIPGSVSDGHGVFQLVQKTKTKEDTFGWGNERKYYTDYDYSAPVGGFIYRNGGNKLLGKSINSLYVSSPWVNRLIVTEQTNTYVVNLLRYGYTGRILVTSDELTLDDDTGSYNRTNSYGKFLTPLEVGLRNPLSLNWFNRTIDAPTPTPTPTPAVPTTTTYPVKINFRHKHDNSLVTDVYYLIGDLKPSPGHPYGKTLYSGWSDTGTIDIELEHRSMDDPNFPQQYRITGKKYGYYDGEIIVSHLMAPYTFNVIMEDSSVTPTVDTNLIEFRIQERFSDSYINDAILTIYDCESEVEVYNETVTGGIVKVRLNQTDTGYAYPHYRVNVYSEGYADFTEYILALYQDGIMRCRLTKVTTPLDPGNVILHVYTVRLDSNDNVVNVGNVKVTVGGIEKVTNSAGYTWFEVPKNSTQMYTAEHPQYAVMSGSVLVEEGERFLHIWMQAPDIGITPTPTVITPTPTPDYSTPTGPIDAVYNLFSMLGIPTLFIGFILTALIAIGCMIFAESFAEGTGLYAGILGVLISAGMGLIPLWIVITFVFIGGIFYMKVIRGDG